MSILQLFTISSVWGESANISFKKNSWCIFSSAVIDILRRQECTLRCIKCSFVIVYPVLHGKRWYHTNVLKEFDTFSNCHRPVFSLGVSQAYDNKPCKFELNWSLNLRATEEKTPLSRKLCAFRCLELETSAEVLKSNETFQWEITSFLKLRYFRGSHFSQYCILSTAHHCSLPSKFFMLKIILSNYQKCPVPLSKVTPSCMCILYIKYNHKFKSLLDMLEEHFTFYYQTIIDVALTGW